MKIYESSTYSQITDNSRVTIDCKNLIGFSFPYNKKKKI